MLEGDHRVKEIARLIDGGSERAYDVALELINSYKRGDMNG
jgi:DNA repair ATPase RecN